MKDILSGLTLVLQLGLTILIPTGLLMALGLWLDGRYGTSFTLPLMILGVLGGGKGAYNLIMSVVRETGKDEHGKQ